MGVTPNTIIGKIQFAEDHVQAWTDNSVPMGSSAAAVTDWHGKVTAARAAFAAQQGAELARKNATNDLHLAVNAMMEATSSIVQSVRSKAKIAGDSVYSLASLPVPSAPSPKPAPGKPTDPKISLDETGLLTLSFKCENPVGTSGTIYQVWRQIGESGTLTYLGGVGEKKFVDDTLPAGSTNIVYQVQAVRSTAKGPWATFNVRFGQGGPGAGGSGAPVASVTETTAPPPKIAA